jgi:hypothetical protein
LARSDLSVPWPRHHQACRKTPEDQYYRSVLLGR